MTTETTQTPEIAAAPAFSREAVARLSAIKNEPEWMRQKRYQAWLEYDSTTPPKWERTDIRRLDFHSLEPIIEPRQPKQLDQLDAAHTNALGGYLLHSEGKLISRRLDKSLAD